MTDLHAERATSPTGERRTHGHYDRTTTLERARPDPDVTLELDDIQAAVLHPRPTPLRRRLHPAAHRRPARRPELLRRLHPDRSPPPPSPAGSRQAGLGSPWRSPSRVSRRWACRRTSLASFPPEFQQGMAARAADAGRHRRERARALGGAARGPGRPPRALRAGPGRRAPGGGARRRPRRPAGAARRRADLAAGHLHAAERADLVRVQGRHQPPGHRGQRHPRHQPARGAVQGRRVHPGLPERERRTAPDAAARGARPQRHLRRLPQAPDPRGGLPPVRPRPAPRARPRRSCWPPSSSAAGRAARRWRSPRSATTPSWGPTRSATTPSSTSRTTTLAGSSARSAPTPGG